MSMTTVTQDPNDASFMTTVTSDSSVASIGTESTMPTTGSYPTTTLTVSADSSTHSTNSGTTAGSSRASHTSGIIKAPPATTTPNQVSMSTTTNDTLFCPEPSSIVGGSTISRGPYAANVSSAVFSCYAGYNLNGPAKVVCSAAGLWASKFPQCVPINNQPKVDNHLTFNQDSGSVPLWLLIVLAVAVGLLCLLVLTCLLLYCLKLFGCWKGGLGSKLGSQSRVHDIETFHDDFGRNDAYRPKRVSYVGDESRIKQNRGSDFGTQTRRVSSETTTSTAVRGWDVNRYRREAKMPAKLTWMPHSNNVRHYNTSTK